MITERPAAQAKAEVEQMLKVVKHEDFYNTGTFSIESQGLYIGWVTLKGSFSDCMPITNEAGDRILFFSGENYLNRELSASLQRGGFTPTEVSANYLVHAYESSEDDFLSSLNGWFCGVIVDLRRGVTLLFNDRYGIGRTYIYEASDGFYFASEAKALLKVRKELRQIDPQGLGEFFACDCVLDNRTLFRGMKILPGGSVWTFVQRRLVKKESYFSPEMWENQEPLTEQLFHEEFEATFKSLLPRYFGPVETLAMSVTGGLDSRMILACLSLAPGSLPCYTFDGMGKETYDVSIGRQVATACGHPHRVVRLGQEFLSNYPSYAEKTVYISEGYHDVCGAHDIYFNRVARTIAPIRMSGKFGSEIVRWSRHLKVSPPSLVLFDKWFRKYVDMAANSLARIEDFNRLSFAAFVEIPLHEYGRLAVERSQLIFRTPYMDNDLVRLMYRGLQTITDPDQIPLRIIRKCKPQIMRIKTDRGFRRKDGLVSWITKHFYWTILYKGDWFFTYMPQRYSKLGRVLEQLGLGRLFRGRHIITNYRSWFQHELRGYVSDILLSCRARSRDYINAKELEKMLYLHLAGQRCYLFEINKALTAELIHQLLIEKL